MQFSSFSYLIFILILSIIYFTAPKKIQNITLLIGSITFYIANTKLLTNFSIEKIIPFSVLVFSVIFTYFMAIKIDSAKLKIKKKYLFFAISVCVIVLCFFKYSNFIIPTLLNFTGLNALNLPLGISFYTFASIGYLIDVYRKDVEAEKNIIVYANFVCFFATIISGPICRAGKIIPQLKKEHSFNYINTTKNMRITLIGYFKQIAIANVLALFCNQVFENLSEYSGFILTITMLVYSLQLYFEFSGYSDIALASAGILGIEIPQNFKTPYFTTNFSAFWSRWHISLSNWLQDYIFMPLVWGGWHKKIPVLNKVIKGQPILISLFLVFFISGFWHGNTLPFVFWGILQAVYRIGEELMHRVKKPIKKPKLNIRILKTSFVYILWSVSLVFFRIGLVESATINDGVNIIFSPFFISSKNGLWNDIVNVISTSFYSNNAMVLLYIVYLVLTISIGIYMDYYQCWKLKNKHISIAIENKKNIVVRYLIYYVLISFILVGFIMNSGGFASGNFGAYANF